MQNEAADATSSTRHDWTHQDVATLFSLSFNDWQLLAFAEQ